MTEATSDIQGGPEQAGVHQPLPALYGDRILFLGIVVAFSLLFLLLHFTDKGGTVFEVIFASAAVSTAIVGVMGGGGWFKTKELYLYGVPSFFVGSVVIFVGLLSFMGPKQEDIDNLTEEHHIEINKITSGHQDQIFELQTRYEKLVDSMLVRLQLNCVHGSRIVDSHFVVVSSNNPDFPHQLPLELQKTTGSYVYVVMPAASVRGVTGSVPSGYTHLSREPDSIATTELFKIRYEEPEIQSDGSFISPQVIIEISEADMSYICGGEQ